MPTASATYCPPGGEDHNEQFQSLGVHGGMLDNPSDPLFSCMYPTESHLDSPRHSLALCPGVLCIKTASSTKQKGAMRCHPPNPQGCRSMGPIGIAVSSECNKEGHCRLSFTTTSFRQVCREIGKGKQVVHHPPICEEKLDLDWPVPHPHSWSQSISYSVALPSTVLPVHEITLGQSHSSPGSQPMAINIHRHLPATLASMHANSHSLLMGSACRSPADAPVALPFSPSAYGNLSWEGSISLQLTPASDKHGSVFHHCSQDLNKLMHTQTLLPASLLRTSICCYLCTLFQFPGQVQPICVTAILL